MHHSLSPVEVRRRLSDEDSHLKATRNSGLLASALTHLSVLRRLVVKRRVCIAAAVRSWDQRD